MDHFIHRFNLRKERNIQGLSNDVLDFFMDYPFPGNVRELENIIEYAFITCKVPVIGLKHLPRDLLQGTDRPRPTVFSAEREEAEKIRALLKQYSSSRPKAARALGISRTTLWHKMKKYGIAASKDET